MKIGTDPDAEIVLLPGRAAVLPASATLLVADLHLGKAATFRKAGIPVPEGSAQRDLARLADGPRRLGARCPHAAQRDRGAGLLLLPPSAVEMPRKEPYWLKYT